MHADFRSWLGVAAGLTVAMGAIAIGDVGHLVYLMDVHPGVAGWAQTIFSVVAIIASVLLATTIDRANSRREADIRAQDRRATLVACSRLVTLFHIKTLAAIQGRQEEKESSRFGVPTVRGFRTAADLMRGVPIESIHSADAVVAYVSAISLADDIALFVEQANSIAIDGPSTSVERELRRHEKTLQSFSDLLAPYEIWLKKLAHL